MTIHIPGIIAELSLGFAHLRAQLRHNVTTCQRRSPAQIHTETGHMSKTIPIFL